MNHKAPEKSHATGELFGYNIYIFFSCGAAAQRGQGTPHS